jgi:hypothetical protein
MLVAVAVSAVLRSAPFVQSFSTPGRNVCNQRRVTGNKVSLFMDLSSGSNLMSSDSSNLDRFRSVCLVGTESKEAVDEFDPDLYSSLDNRDSDNAEDDDDMWVAVYRSNNNKPSVVVRDDFFRAMNDATSGKNEGDGSTSNSESDDPSASNPVSTVSGAASFLSDTMPSLLEIPSTKPVAIARLIKSETSTDTKPVYLLDNLRCSLKKENQDESCDGGSEFVEALSVAVDTLLLKHLQRLLQHRQGGSNDDGKAADVVFEGTVRTKATLFSGKLFEQRGFAEVESLSKDMATHVSNYEACFSKYADRTIEATMAAGTRDRALQIVALLGRLDAEVQKKEAEASGGGDDDEYDPWANMQLYRS